MFEDLKNHKHIVGIKQSTRAVEADNVRAAYVARDADDTVIQPFAQLCASRLVPITMVESKKALGELCGIEVDAAVAVVLKQ